MSTTIDVRRFKAPRWISTEAGQWAYEASEEWRRVADQTFVISERRQLLDEAELLLKRTDEAQSA
jgi:hypothetical protein